MKTTLYLKVTALLAVCYVNAQVAIGKSTVDGDGLLDFVSGTTNGIILPVVGSLPVNPVNGTILLDASTPETFIQLKFYENGNWVELSESGNIDNVIVNNSEDVGGGVIIGSETSEAEGVLVLESTDKALILPKVQSPDTTVLNPYPGMICYDTQSKTIAMFDGLVWNYWK